MDLEDFGIICLVLAVLVLGICIDANEKSNQKENRAEYADCIKNSENKDWCIETSFDIKLVEPKDE